MEIEYTIKLRDLVRFNLYHASRYLPNHIIIVIIVTIFAFAAWNTALSVVANIFVIALITLGGIIGFFAATAFFALIGYRPSKNLGVLGHHTLALSEDSLTERTSVNTATYSWSGVPKVAQTRSYIFIYVQQHVAHIIPKRAFSSSTAADQFYQSAVSAWRAAGAA